MKIAILYIALGKYDLFFKNFYCSAEKYFLPEAQKQYFVFTDSKLKKIFAAENITRLSHCDMGWPNNTLKRFEIFLSKQDQLETYDYIFFFNANMEFVTPISVSVLPADGLICVQHPGFYSSSREEFPYETNPQSVAAISPNEGKIYVCGGVNGGTSGAYLEMCHTLMRNIQKDEENGIVASVHDESHLNRYIIGRSDVTIWGPEYCYPDFYHLPGREMKIHLLWKQNYINVYALRGNKQTFAQRVYWWLRETYHRAQAGILFLR